MASGKTNKYIKFDTIPFSESVAANHTSMNPVEFAVNWNSTGKQLVSVYVKDANFCNWLLWATPVYKSGSSTINIQIRNYYDQTLTATATIVVAYIDS